jgi:putative transposase
MEDFRKSSHTVSWLSVHIVWVTKYRYHVLKGNVQLRCRDLLVQICNSENVKILKGVVIKYEEIKRENIPNAAERIP